MSLKIYNSLGRELQDFIPLQEGKVNMYVCGPTVYDLLHVGNFRGAIVFNVVRNWLEKSGYDVTFVYNYTDIDDKIINRANENGEDPLALSQRFTVEFQKDFQRLKLTPHSHNPKCSDHIQDMIDMIADLIEKEHAYVIDGSVFYAIRKFKEYGKLSGKNIESLEAGHRVDPDTRKKDPLDFILWKPAKEGEPSWDSPWGPGRPGWHIECSAMNHAYFGPQIDIHGGGIDLIFPHHENEIAQSEAYTGRRFSKYWMHNNFINFGNTKMSKSLGNVVKAREFMDQYHPEILKFMMLHVHYRSPLSLATEQVYQSIQGLARIYSVIKQSDQIIATVQGEAQEVPEFQQAIVEAQAKIEKSMNDDFGTPSVFAAVFEVVRLFNATYKPGKKNAASALYLAQAFQSFLEPLGKVLALFQEPAAEFLQTLDQILIKEKNIDVARVEELIAKRNNARQNKDYALADQCRDELVAMDVLVQDAVDGTTWEVKKT